MKGLGKKKKEPFPKSFCSERKRLYSVSAGQYGGLSRTDKPTFNFFPVFACGLKKRKYFSSIHFCMSPHKGILYGFTQRYFVWFHTKVFCMIPHKGILYRSTERYFLFFHRKVFCMVPRKGILYDSTQRYFVWFHRKVFCMVPHKGILVDCKFILKCHDMINS